MKQSDASQVELPCPSNVLFCFASELAVAEPSHFDGTLSKVMFCHDIIELF